MFILGLTGERNVGKTTIADYLVANYGFVRAHPFEGGKHATLGYYLYIGIPESIAKRMIWGDLKDVPSEYLPNNQTSRYFMEKLGYFMPTELGVEWTLGKELEKISQDYNKTKFELNSYNNLNPQQNITIRPLHIVVESLVYESSMVEKLGKIVLVERLLENIIVGEKTSEAVKTVKHDYVIKNYHDKASLFNYVDTLMHYLGVDYVVG